MTIKLALIGLGGIAQKGYLPALGTWPELELMLCTRDAQTLSRLAQQYRVAKVTTDIKQVLAWKPDAACVLAATDAHYTLVKPLLESGIDVFVEKPATRTLAQTEELANLADQNNLLLMIAFNRRFSPLSQKLKAMTEKHSFSLAYFQKNRPTHLSPDFGRHNRDGVIHQVDLMRHLLGEGSVLLSTYRLNKGRAIAESSATIQLDRGGLVVINGSLSAGKWHESAELHGDSASVFLEQFRRLEYIHSGERHVWEQPYDVSWETTLVGRGIIGELQHFFDCLKTRRQPLTNGWESLKSQQLIEDIITKAKEI